MSYSRLSDEWFDGKPRGRAAFVPYNAKIADITHADTNKHTLDLAAALSEARKILGILCGASRIAGTGEFRYYPNESAQSLQILYGLYTSPIFVIVADGTNRLQYSQQTANDDWDLYCFGYVVEA